MARISTVNGNIKFDAVQKIDWSPAKTDSPARLSALIESARPVIVAGCITDYAAQQKVLDAFVTVRERRPHALLILAPRPYLCRP